MTRYELLDRIGVGGMAEIFRGKAVAAGGFEKPVAIKRILPHLSQDKRFVELLIAEAKVLSLLKHRNIVQIFDVGLGDDGQYFLVMEYVDGKDLGRIQRGIEMRRGRIAFDLALHVGAEICEALEHAHSARSPDGHSMSLVHRDVSPSNVLVSRAGEVKLTDFGIAKRAEHEPTRHGAVRGKFAYISPEQARNEHLDPRSDVFPVGILLWELVTNRRLFSGLGDLDALRAVRDGKVRRPREIDPRLSPEIDELIMAALAPTPHGRPTAGQLGAKLRSLRYALDVTVGDPATELAKIIDSAEEAERMSAEYPAVPQPRNEFDGTEATVIRIHTAEHFLLPDQDGTGMARALRVIDRFEEEETRQAQLSREEIAFLHAGGDSGEMTSAGDMLAPPPPPARSHRPSAELTRAHMPLSTEDLPAIQPPDGDRNPFDDAEATRLLGPSARRTPAPSPLPPQLPAARPPTLDAKPPSPPPGLTHERGDRTGLASPPAGSTSHPPPPMQSLSPQLSPQMSPSATAPPVLGMQPLPPPSVQPPMGGNYPNWGSPAPARPTQPPPQQRFERPAPRPVAAPPSGRYRKTPLKAWVLVVGALIMALLAFAVTRACIHSTASRPAASEK